MTLRPCPACRRHVAAHESACPFCGGRTTVIPSRAIATVSKLSRAAIFAGAAACYTSTPDAKQPPPPPPNEVAPPADTHEVPPPDTQTFAQPPTVGTGRIRGIVRRSGPPLANTVLVDLVPLDGTSGGGTVETDRQGRFVFDKLQPGHYQLQLGGHVSGREPPPSIHVDVADGSDQEVVLQLRSPPPVDRGPCCKPYGAPPARRRVV
jgi:hypothetical protein